MTHSIPISSLTISPSRQRQEFDPEALTDLANSISTHGLLHAPVMRETLVRDSIGVQSEQLILVAGERRIRAIESLWALDISIRYNGELYSPGNLPYVTLGELTPLEAEEAELDENLKRSDLTWQEESSAIARLHALRQAQAALIGSTHSVANTVTELSTLAPTSFDSVRKSILLADHLDKPEVANAKSAKEAFKALKRTEDRESNQALAARVGRTFNSSVHSLVHADCLDWLSTCPANSFDVILTDPPYGVNAQEFGDGGGKLVNSEHHYDDSIASWRSLMGKLIPGLWRVAKPQSHCYMFCDLDNFSELRKLLRQAGWYVFRTPLITYKLNSGRVPLPEHGPRRQYETILYAIKGNRPVTAIYSDVIPCKLEENLGHGAQKPVELYVDLLRRSVRPGDAVLDCFAGTGTIFPACHQMKVIATGVEMSAEYYGLAVNRLNSLDSEPEML